METQGINAESSSSISQPNATLYISNVDWKIKKAVLKRALLSLLCRHGKVSINHSTQHISVYSLASQFIFIICIYIYIGVRYNLLKKRRITRTGMGNI